MASLGSSSAKVMLGRMAAIGVGFVCAPVVSRMFDPAEYGVAVLVESMIYWIMGFAALGYAQAIPLSDDEGELRGLVRLNFVINGALLAVLCVLVLLFGDSIAGRYGQRALAQLIWYVPPLFLLSAISDTAQYAFSRQGRFGVLSLLVVVTTGLGQPMQIVMGWLFGGTASMLLLGASLSGVLGAIIACVVLVPLMSGSGGSAPTMRAVAWRRQQFPRVQLWNAVLLATSYALPVMIFGIMFASDEATVGLFGRGRKLIMLPVMVLAISLGQVFYPQAADEWRREGSARDSILGTFRILSMLCVFPTVCLCYLGPLLFSLFLGEKWREAGVYAQLCGPYVIFLIFAGPLKWMFLIRDRAGRFFVYNVLAAVGEPIGLVAGALIGGAPMLRELTGFAGVGWMDGARAAVLVYAIAGSLARAPLVVEAVRLGGVRLAEVVGLVAREIAVAMIVLLPAGVVYWAGGPDAAAVALACAAAIAYLAVLYRREESVRRWVARMIGWDEHEETTN